VAHVTEASLAEQMPHAHVARVRGLFLNDAGSVWARRHGFVKAVESEHRLA
jgi:hypothetical protein